MREMRPVLEGLPPDLIRVLRDQGITIEKDSDLWALVGKWADAPSDTASAAPNQDGPYTIVLDYDGTQITWSSMYAHNNTFHLLFGDTSLARARARDET